MSNVENILPLLLRLDVDRMKIKGGCAWVLKDAHGKLKQAVFVPNTITVTGDNATADWASDRGEPQVNWMAVGTTAGGKDTSSTALEAQAGIVECDSRTQTDNDVAWVGTFPAGTGTGTLIEAGLFNIATGLSGMYAYQEGFTITKAAGDSLVGTWTVSYGVS